MICIFHFCYSQLALYIHENKLERIGSMFSTEKLDEIWKNIRIKFKNLLFSRKNSM